MENGKQGFRGLSRGALSGMLRNSSTHCSTCWIWLKPTGPHELYRMRARARYYPEAVRQHGTGRGRRKTFHSSPLRHPKLCVSSQTNVKEPDSLQAKQAPSQFEMWMGFLSLLNCCRHWFIHNPHFLLFGDQQNHKSLSYWAEVPWSLARWQPAST